MGSSPINSHGGSSKFLFFYIFGAINASIVVVFIYRYLHTHLSDSPLLELTESASGYYFPVVPGRLAAYIAGSLLIGGAFAVNFWLFNKGRRGSLFDNRSLIFMNVLAGTALCVSLKAPVWAVPILPPLMAFLGYFSPKIIGKNWFLTLNRRLPLIVLSGAVLSVFMVYRDLLFPQIFIENAYYRIPEEYRIKKGFLFSGEGEEFINTTTLINSQKFLGHMKIDAITAANWRDAASCDQLPQGNALLDKIVKGYREKEYLQFKPYTIYTVHNAKIGLPPVLYYGQERLCVVWSADEEQNILLRSRLESRDVKIPHAENIFIDNYEPPTDYNELGLANYDQRARYYMLARPETVLQLIRRGSLSHHLHYIIPAQEYLLGKPLGKISHQYGLALTMVSSVLAKIFGGGDIEYAVFIKALAWTAPLCLLIFIGSIYGLFNGSRRLAPPVMVLAFSQFLNTYNVILGDAGLRGLLVILDLPMIYIFSKFIENRSVGQVTGLFLLSLGALFLNFNFGLFLSAALIYALIVESLPDKLKVNALNIILLCLPVFIGFRYFNIGSSFNAKYFLLGSFSGPVSPGFIAASLLIFFFHHVLYLYLRQNGYDLAPAYIFSAVYAQILLIYYLIMGHTNHLWIYFSRFSLPFVFILDFWLFYKLKFDKRDLAYKTVVACLTALICLAAYRYESSRNFWSASFNAHKHYEWSAPNAGFVSTMNPQYFNDSTALIKKYLPEAQKEAFLISQYGPFLNFLSKKYSGFPHFDLAAYLITAREKAEALAAVRKSAPEYIFVDSDIDSPYELDIVPSSLYPMAVAFESRLRVRNLNDMKELWRELSPDYEFVEAALLLSVYKRKAYSNSK